jgi:hypothetical protein
MIATPQERWERAERQIDGGWYAALIHAGLLLVLLGLNFSARTLSRAAGIQGGIEVLLLLLLALGVARRGRLSALGLVLAGGLWTLSAWAVAHSIVWSLVGCGFTACYIRGLIGVSAYHEVMAEQLAAGTPLWRP